MKKVVKVLLGIVLAFVVLAVVCGILMTNMVRTSYKQLDAVQTVDVSAVADGVYEGNAETPLVKVTAVVTVKDHQIADIELTRHQNGKGTPAEAMIPKMIEENTSEVDSIAGVTMSSKTIKAAVRNALAAGAN